jgi:hypothetical protein
MELLQKEIAEKSEQVKELNRSKAELEQLKREKEEMAEQAKAELQKRINESLKIEREKTEKRLKEQFALEPTFPPTHNEVGGSISNAR